MPVITVPKVLREKLGEDGADSIVELINLANQKVKEDVIETSSEKFERRLIEEISKLDNRISDVRAELIKWMFIFWIGQFTSIVVAITAILFAFFKR